MILNDEIMHDMISIFHKALQKYIWSKFGEILCIDQPLTPPLPVLSRSFTLSPYLKYVCKCLKMIINNLAFSFRCFNLSFSLKIELDRFLNFIMLKLVKLSIIMWNKSVK